MKKNILWLGPTERFDTELVAADENWFAIVGSTEDLPDVFVNVCDLEIQDDFDLECYWEKRAEVLDVIRSWELLRGPFHGIVAPSEYTLELGAWIRTELGIKGPQYDEMKVFRDKALQKERILRACIPTAKSWIDLETVEDAKLVLKPRKQAGSRGVHFFENKRELETYVDAQGFDLSSHIIEEFVHGNLIHIDGLVRDAILVECVGSRYLEACYDWLNYGSPMGSVAITEADCAAKVDDFCKKVIQALSVKDTAFHLEAFETLNGELYFLEIAARPGGAAIVPALKKAIGLDLMREKILCDLGKPCEYVRNNAFHTRHFGWIVNPMPSKRPFVVKGYIGLNKLPASIEAIEVAKRDRVYNAHRDEGLATGKLLAFRETGTTENEIREDLLKASKIFSLEIVEL